MPPMQKIYRKLIQGNHRKYLVVVKCFLDNQFKEIGKNVWWPLGVFWITN
jgi:hypothetical protein